MSRAARQAHPVAADSASSPTCRRFQSVFCFARQRVSKTPSARTISPAFQPDKAKAPVFWLNTGMILAMTS
jgi:hypothetical protein